MFEKESISAFSFQEIEKAIAEALEKLTGKSHKINISSINFNATDRGYHSPQMVVNFSENRPYVPLDEVFKSET